MAIDCDVLVVGAGPAGSACAQVLASAGQQVQLVDQHSFPRDKVCGDGLIPDSLAALRRLGVAAEVASQATSVRHVRLVGSRGGQVDVPGVMAVLPRRTLDHILQRAALRAGAQFSAPLRFEAPLVQGNRVVGARLKDLSRGGEAVEIRARWVVLATGAVPAAMTAAGLCERHTPSGVALRAYVKNEGMADRITQLHIVWHKRLKGGYGWVFPTPGGVFNIGTGITGSHSRSKDGKGRMQDNNLRRMFEAFCEVYPPAAELMRGGIVQGDLKGAPLRCSLVGARWSRPGMLATGEAIGSTYAFSGEGIGKAMETGIKAAEAVLSVRDSPNEAHSPASDTQVQAHYELALKTLKPQFELYEYASVVNLHPWLADLVIWRARRSPRILQRLSGVLDETQNPGRLFTFSGMRKLLFE